MSQIILGWRVKGERRVNGGYLADLAVVEALLKVGVHGLIEAGGHRLRAHLIGEPVDVLAVRERE